jgi:hypothetical protein
MGLMRWASNVSRDNVQMGYEANHSPPSTADMCGAIIFFP